jgi:hypothetical protein
MKVYGGVTERCGSNLTMETHLYGFTNAKTDMQLLAGGKTTMKLISRHSKLKEIELKQMELSQGAVIPPLQKVSIYFPSMGAI